MSAPALIKVDKATFYRFVANAPEDERYEYVQGRIVQQQQGGTKRHGRVAGRIAEICRRQLDDSRWEVLEGRGVETSATIRFGDVVIEPTDEPDESIATLRPALVVEVLSPTSGERDLTTKPAEYTSLASLQAYIVASQEGPECLVWVRDAAGTFPPDGVRVAGRDATIAIPALGLSIPLADVYRGM
ncbi:MAG: Uma2 family endonuclease [Hyphomicrobiaceae bacterium]